MNVKKTRKKRVISLFILFTFLIGVITNPILLFSRFGYATVQEEDIAIQEGYNIFQNLPYNYQGTFYEDSDPTFAWTTAKIEFVYDPTAYSPLSYEYIVTDDFTNSESRQPYDETNVTMTTGEYLDTTNMQSDDNDYAQFDYEGIGVYRASYSFTDELDGTFPSGWIDNDGTGTETTVISYLDGHRKVLDFDDQSNLNYAGMYQTYSGQITGTIEFWWRIDTSASMFYLSLGTGNNIWLGFHSTGQFAWANVGWGYTNVQAFSADIWYHHRIVWDSGTDTYDWYIDGSLVANNVAFRYGLTSITRTYWISSGTSTGYHTYIDAIGYSWDNDYMVGWNREEYAFFGDYPAAYSFEGDDIGDNPAGFSVLESGGTVNVIGGIGGHKKVVELHDIDAGNNIILVRTFSSAKTSGTIEVWIRMGQTDKINYIYLYSDVWPNPILDLRIESNGEFKIDHGGGRTYIQDYVANQWYHIKIDFECGAGGYKGLAADTFNFYVDGVLLVDGWSFINNAVNLLSIYFITHTTQADAYYYVDALDYSWSPGYSNGRNRLTANDDILGHYPATHSFPFDDVGGNPNDGTSDGALVVGSVGKHRKVISTIPVGGNPDVDWSITWIGKTTGIIEGWYRYVNNNDYNYIQIYEGGDIKIWIYRPKGINTLKYLNSLAVWVDLWTGLVMDTWYHFRIDFDVSTDTFDFYGDGVSKGTELSFREVATELDSMRLRSLDDDATYYGSYWDALDFSWDPYYSVGRNVNPTKANLLGQYPGTYSSDSFVLILILPLPLQRFLLL